MSLTSEQAAFLALDEEEIRTARDRATVMSANDMGNAILATLGGGGSPADPYENSYEFVTRNHLTLDGQPFTLDTDYKHLRPVYEDEHRFQTLMAGAQTGKTGRLLAHLARTAFGAAYGRMIGYYFPDKHLPIIFSRSRFKPFIRSNAALARTLGAQMAGGADGQDAVLSMNLGETMVFFMTIGGKTATEGLPLKAVYFDEVRKMRLGDIERAEERYSAQTDAINIKVSTARYPESDIHKFFLEGDQRYFHTECGCAGEGVVLSLTFPDCIADLRNASSTLKRKVAHAYEHAGIPYLGMTDEERGQYPAAAFVCPKCGEVLVDPREGWWEPHAPNNWAHSWQMPQLISPTFSAGRVLGKFEKNEDFQEFMNSALGLPYVDRDKMPVQGEHIDACVDTTLQWAAHLSYPVRRRRIVNCSAGVDVQAGYGILVVKQTAENGKQRTVHLEVLRNPKDEPDKTWWHVLGQRMHDYQIRLVVIDEAPEFTASLAFAKAFPGRVYLANFALGDNAPRFVQWDDQTLDDDHKQKGQTAHRHRVSLQRTKALHWSLMRWKNRLNEVPPLTTLIQVLPLQGEKVVFSSHLRIGVEGPAAVGMVLRDHLTRFVFRDVVEDDPKAKIKLAQGQKRWVAEFLGGSPDFAFADLYAAIAADRIGVPAGIRRLGD